MKLSELILAVGDENVKFQRLDECATSFSTNKQGVTTVQFKTRAISTSEVFAGDPKTLGLVLWIPKERLPKT